MYKAYLTIDDSPSVHTTALVDFLHKRSIPALLFIRGDLMAANPAPIIYAIERGLVIGNHGYNHKPAGDLTFEAWAEDFEKTEQLINKAYDIAGQERPGHYYRFPYIDRGDGVRIEQVFARGEACTLKDNKDISKIQGYLKKQGVYQPFKNMPKDYPIDAADSLFTYTSADWMLNTRHKGHWDIQDIAGLKARIDEDQGLKAKETHHIVLLHDQEGIFDEFCALINYFCEKGFTFLDF